MSEKGQAARQVFEATGARLIVAELDLAITFCMTGLTSRQASRVASNVENAKRALEAASRMKEKIGLSRAEEKQIAEKTSMLKSRGTTQKSVGLFTGR